MVVGSLTVETDVVVIGGGPGGYVAAIRAAQLGKDVMLIDENKSLGGVCLNTGCIPTKAMIHASDFFHTIKDMESMGISIKDYSVDISKMRDWKNGIVQKLAGGVSMLCKKHGVEVLEGKAIFVSKNELRVEGKSDVNKVKFKDAIIATGSHEIEIPGFPFKDELVISSKDALDLKEIPANLVIIGGGYIGTEMGTVYGKLGSNVTIIEAMDRLIPSLQESIVSVVANKLKEFNVKTILKAKALGYESRDGKAIVKISVDGKESVVEADKVLVVVGRKPNTEGIGLEAVNVKLDEKGFIKVDETMKTSSDNIYAVGDVVGQPLLAHKASREGKVAAEAICGQPSAFDNKVIPFVVFNDPEIASVGLTEEQAKQKGHEVIKGKFPFTALGRALTLNQTDGFVEVIADKKTKIVLGVHAVGPNVSDMISEATLAIEMNATLEDISSTIHPHPTIPESLMEAAEATIGKSVHIFTPKK